MIKKKTFLVENPMAGTQTATFAETLSACKRLKKKREKKVLSRDFCQKKMPAYTVKKYRLSTVKVKLSRFNP